MSRKRRYDEAVDRLGSYVAHFDQAAATVQKRLATVGDADLDLLLEQANAFLAQAQSMTVAQLSNLLAGMEGRAWESGRTMVMDIHARVRDSRNNVLSLVLSRAWAASADQADDERQCRILEILVKMPDTNFTTLPRVPALEHLNNSRWAALRRAVEQEGRLTPSSWRSAMAEG